MSIIIKKNKQAESILASVKKLSGVDVSVCLQCKKCSNGCPVSTLAMTRPSDIIKKLQLHMDEQIFNSDLIWMCASCETCFSRCPMKIDMAAVMDTLRHISLKRKAIKQKGNVPLFNKSFLKTVQLFGRTYDLGMIAAYKMGTSTYLQDTNKFPMMLKKRKIALLPNLKADKTYTNRIFNKAKNK